MNHPSTYKLCSIFIFSLLSTFPFQLSKAQCSSQGALSGSVFSDDNATGVYTFSSPSNAAVSDNNRTTAAATIGLFSGNTHYLKATSFGFSIPGNANICGIEVQIEKSASNISLLATVNDNVVRLMKAGLIAGNNYATSSDWSTSESYFTYGGPADLWGTTWTSSDINASNFGLAFSAQIHGLLDIISIFPVARIDHIQIKVYYVIPVPVHFVSFNATLQKNNNVSLKWVTADNDETVVFEVQHSTNASEWNMLHTLQGNINAGLQQYSFIDTFSSNTTKTYYRIKMILRSGKVLFTKVISVVSSDHPILKLFPNPSDDYLLIYASNNPVINLTTTTGSSLPVKWERISPTQVRISTAMIRKGYYIIRVDQQSAIFIKQ
jgi:hypothetical protein